MAVQCRVNFSLRRPRAPVTDTRPLETNATSTWLTLEGWAFRVLTESLRNPHEVLTEGQIVAGAGLLAAKLGRTALTSAVYVAEGLHRTTPVRKGDGCPGHRRFHPLETLPGFEAAPAGPCAGLGGAEGRRTFLRDAEFRTSTQPPDRSALADRIATACVGFLGNPAIHRVTRRYKTPHK